MFQNKGNVIVNLVIVTILKIIVEVNLKNIFCRNSQYFRSNVLLISLEGTKRGGKYIQIILFLCYCITLNLKNKYVNIIKKLNDEPKTTSFLEGKRHGIVNWLFLYVAVKPD